MCLSIRLFHNRSQILSVEKYTWWISARLLNLLLVSLGKFKSWSVVFDTEYIANQKMVQINAFELSFNLQYQPTLYIAWFRCNLQKFVADFREITSKMATGCVCSIKLFPWQHLWCLYCVEEKGKSSFYCSHSSFKPHGGRMESKMKKRGMEDLIAVKLQLLHGVSYLILF